jgi:hypothetical protein
MALRTLSLAFLAAIMGTGIAAACEDFKSHTTDDMKEFRKVLSSEEADPFDRIFAFQELACSDQPVMRAYAIKAALENSSDELVRNQVLLAALLQKKRIDIEIMNPDNNSQIKEFLSYNHGGIFRYSVMETSEKLGFLSFDDGLDYNYKNRRGLFIEGDRVEVSYGNIVGTFRLLETNDLIGTISYPNKGIMPAKIELF